MITIILAGGSNNGFKVNYPRILLKVNQIPMIVRSINNAILLKSEMIIIVVNLKNKDQIERIVKQYVKNRNIFYTIQNEPLGTGDAIRSCIPYLEEIDPFDDVLILNADIPTLSFYTINTFLKWDNDNDSRILCSVTNDPTGYGRLIRDKRYNFIKIVEEKDCNEEEKKISYINGGVYKFKNYQILENIKLLKKEENTHDITDLINIIKPAIYMLESKWNKELINVNDRASLKKVESIYKK